MLEPGYIIFFHDDHLGDPEDYLLDPEDIFEVHMVPGTVFIGSPWSFVFGGGALAPAAWASPFLLLRSCKTIISAPLVAGGWACWSGPGFHGRGPHRGPRSPTGTEVDYFG